MILEFRKASVLRSQRKIIGIVDHRYKFAVILVQVVTALSHDADTDGFANLTMDASHLPLDLISYIADYLPPTDLSASIKVLCKAVHQRFRTFTKLRVDADLESWVLERYFATCTNPERLLSICAKGGFLNHIKCLRSQDPPCPWNRSTCEAAAANGHLFVLAWCREQVPPCPWDKWTSTFAAMNGHIHILDWCWAQNPRCPFHSVYMLVYSAQCGRVASLQWWREHNLEVDIIYPWTIAAEKGHLDVLKWCRAQIPPYPWDKETCIEKASRNGHMHIVDWIAQQP